MSRTFVPCGARGPGTSWHRQLSITYTTLLSYFFTFIHVNAIKILKKYIYCGVYRANRSAPFYLSLTELFTDVWRAPGWLINQSVCMFNVKETSEIWVCFCVKQNVLHVFVSALTGLRFEAHNLSRDVIVLLY